MTEADLKSIVLNLARRYGWLIHHDLPAINRRGRWATHVEGDVGFPDLVLLSPRWAHTMVIELKAEKGKVSPAQQKWLDAFTAAGIETHVIRPSDLEYITHRITRPDLYN